MSKQRHTNPTGIGTVSNPVPLIIPDEAWEESGHLSPRDAANSRLSTTMRMGSTSFHVDAIRVNKKGEAYNSAFDSELSALQEALSEGDLWETTTLRGKEYVIIIHPFAI